MKRTLLLTVGILCSLLSAQAFTVTYAAIDKPEGWEEMMAWTSTYIPSGSGVSLGENVTFKTPGAAGYAVDWYVNGEKVQQPSGFTFKLIITSSVHVEARYREAYKFVFEGTPYVRYANEMGYATLLQNLYHNDFVSEKGTSHTVDYWMGSNGKRYDVDRTPTDNLYVNELLTSDVILSPHYVLSGKSIGDSTVIVNWRFDQPATGLLLRNMKGRAPFVQTIVVEGQYTDIAMTIDATQGCIDNYNNGNWNKPSIPAVVSAGTRLWLPSTYGTCFRILSTEALSANTTIAGKNDFVQSQLPDGSYQSLLYCYSANDTVDLKIGDETHLISVAAMYPGARNTLVWKPSVRTAEPVISTAYKSGEAGALLRHMSNISINGMLQVTPSAADTLTSLIEMPQMFNAQRYMSVDFEVADGYAFLPESAVVPFVPVVSNAQSNILSALWLEDGSGQRIDSLFQKRAANVMNYDSLSYSLPTDQAATKYLQGKVTLKIFVFGTAANYRLGPTLSICGRLYQRIAFPENSQWMPLLVTNGIDFDGTDLRSVEVYEVVDVRERKGYLTMVPVEECAPGTVVMLHAPSPGAVYYVPLTQCDDAFDRNQSILFRSDGTVIGNDDRYIYTTQNGTPVFIPSTNGELIPEGAYYVEYEFMTRHDILFLSETDATPIESVYEKVVQTATRRILKNGRIYIIKPDGTTYNLAGCRQ